MPVTPDFISASVNDAARRQVQVSEKNLARPQQRDTPIPAAP